MENSVISIDELNNLSKETIILLYSQLSQNMSLMSEQFKAMAAQSDKNTESLQKQNEQLLAQITDLKEQIAILTQQRFGSRSEKNLSIPGQLSFDFDGSLMFNEAEAIVLDELPDEKPMEEVITYTRRKAGKRKENLVNIDTLPVVHALSEEELNQKFSNGWHELEDECSGQAFL